MCEDGIHRKHCSWSPDGKITVMVELLVPYFYISQVIHASQLVAQACFYGQDLGLYAESVYSGRHGDMESMRRLNALVVFRVRVLI
jgi:hypothetical protein